MVETTAFQRPSNATQKGKHVMAETAFLDLRSDLRFLAEQNDVWILNRGKEFNRAEEQF